MLQNPLATGYATGHFLHAVLEYTTGQNKIGEGEKPWQVEQAQHKLDRKICAWLSSFFYYFCFLFIVCLFFYLYKCTQGTCSWPTGTVTGK